MGSAESFARLGEFRAPTARWWSSDSTAALAHFPPGFATALAAAGAARHGPDAGRTARAGALRVRHRHDAGTAGERSGGGGRRRPSRYGAVLDGVDARGARVGAERAALPRAARARAVRHGASSGPAVAGGPRRRARDAHPICGSLHRRARWRSGASHAAARSPSGCATPRWRCCRRSCCRDCGSFARGSSAAGGRASSRSTAISAPRSSRERRRSHGGSSRTPTTGTRSCRTSAARRSRRGSSSC